MVTPRILWTVLKQMFSWFFLVIVPTAKSLQSCPTLCDPRDGSPPGSPAPEILQARTLEWVAISFSNAWKWKVKVKSLSRVQFLATPWTAAHQAPPPMGFSRQEYWSGVPLPSPPQLKTKTYHAEWKVFAEESIYDTISKVWKCDKPIQSWYGYICIYTELMPADVQMTRTCREWRLGHVVDHWPSVLTGLSHVPLSLSIFSIIHGYILFSFHFHALEKEMATYSSILAWRIPGTEEPSGLPSMGSHRVGHNWAT